MRASAVETNAQKSIPTYLSVAADGEVAPESHLDPTVPGSIAKHRALVAACTVLMAVAAIGYSLHQPKVFQAHASIAVTQPADSQPESNTSASPEQYVDSQVLLLQSPAVAERAVAVANAALGHAAFVTADFDGTGSSLKVTSQTATDPNSNVVDISFSAKTGVEASAGANAVLNAYAAVRSAQIDHADSSLISAIDSTVNSIDAQLATLTGQGGPVNTELATSLVNERSNLLQQRSVALIDESVNASQTPSIVPALVPTRATNHKLTKTGPIGAVVGFLVGACLAYRLEIRKRRRQRVSGATPVPHPVPLPAPQRAWSPTRAAARGDSDNDHAPSQLPSGYDRRYESPEVFVERTAVALYQARLTELQRSFPGGCEPTGQLAE